VTFETEHVPLSQTATASETDATLMREAEKGGEGGENAQTRTGCGKAGNQGTSQSPLTQGERWSARPPR